MSDPIATGDAPAFPSAEPAASIGERIRAARKRAGLNQANLAARVGVSQPAVANWETGLHDPRRVVLIKIADALGVSADWLGGGARSALEQDKHPAAAYLRRAIQHTPVISLTDAAHLLASPDADPHAVALDYIPVTTSAERVFAFFAVDDAVDRAFPRNTLVVIDYADRAPADGAFCLAATDDLPVLRRWRSDPPRLETYSSSQPLSAVPVDGPACVIGCARVSIRFH